MRPYQPYRSSRPRDHFRGGGSRVIRSFNPAGIIAAAASSQSLAAPSAAYTPTISFETLPVDPRLIANIQVKGYTTPTPIQDQAISHVLAGRDLIGIANTGTGKTAAFLVPLIDKVIKNRTEKILIIAPTRELATQIQDEFVGFARNLGMYSVLCIGGVNIHPQRQNLRRPHNFVIGTPGRIKDHVQERNLILTNFKSVVLDEADHMLDIGFIQDIKFIVSQLSPIRQSLFFSATIDGKVREILTAFVQDPITISVKTGDTAQNVRQVMVKVPDPSRKIDQLHDLLLQKDYNKVLIFGRTKHGVQKLSDELVKRGFRADAIHGNKNQSQRLRALNKFKREEIKILLATDVASRGLDVPDVTHVINYDLPESKEAYIHRIGRTGRADSLGTALTFI